MAQTPCTTSIPPPSSSPARYLVPSVRLRFLTKKHKSTVGSQWRRRRNRQSASVSQSVSAQRSFHAGQCHHAGRSANLESLPSAVGQVDTMLACPRHDGQPWSQQQERCDVTHARSRHLRASFPHRCSSTLPFQSAEYHPRRAILEKRKTT